jgi:hypothetical protein
MSALAPTQHRDVLAAPVHPPRQCGQHTLKAPAVEAINSQ